MRRFRFAWVLAAFAVRGFAGEVSFSLTDVRGLAVGDAVVSLVPLDSHPALVPVAGVQVLQDNKEFLPYVTAVVTGTRIAFPNEDRVEHHVYSQSKAKSFELALYKPGMNVEVLFDQPGVVVVGCNIHDWMIAYIVVLETPWFSVVGAPGKVTIANVPAGRYRAEVWHPQLAATVTREIVVGAVPTNADFKLTLRPDRRIRRPADAGGAGYP